MGQNSFLRWEFYMDAPAYAPRFDSVTRRPRREEQQGENLACLPGEEQDFTLPRFLKRKFFFPHSLKVPAAA